MEMRIGDGMPPPTVPHFLDPVGFSTDLVFTLLAVLFCFLIYFKTRETYRLTQHKGIGYFREAFLFFGLSYALRFLFGITMLSRIAFDMVPPRAMFMPFLFFMPPLLGYFSTIGIFYLIFSTIWKMFDNRNMLIFGHGAAIALSIVSFITGSTLILLGLQSALLGAAVTLKFVMHRKGEKMSQTKLLYLLVAVLWFINLLMTDRRRPFPLEIEIFFQLLSLAVFFVIYSKISKWVA